MDEIDVHGELENVNRIFDEQLNRIRRLNDEGFHDEAIILTVTISEVILKDIFKLYREGWFNYEESIDYDSPSERAFENNTRIEHRLKICKYLKSIQAYDDFIKNSYVYQLQTPDSEIAPLYHTLFEDESKSKINFQKLNKNSNNAKKAYAIFFGIDLSKMLDKDEKISTKKWSSTIDLFEERHKIIHAGSSTALKKDDIEKVISSLEYLKSELLYKFKSYSVMNLNQYMSENQTPTPLKDLFDF